MLREEGTRREKRADAYRGKRDDDLGEGCRDGDEQAAHEGLSQSGLARQLRTEPGTSQGRADDERRGNRIV
jgi:hypothetical protein